MRETYKKYTFKKFLSLDSALMQEYESMGLLLKPEFLENHGLISLNLLSLYSNLLKGLTNLKRNLSMSRMLMNKMLVLKCIMSLGYLRQ